MYMVLEHLFGSSTRVKVLSLFLKYPHKSFFVRELVRGINGHMHAVRRELEHLEKAGIIQGIETNEIIGNPWGDSNPSDKKKRYYVLSPACVFYEELKSLFSKDAVVGQRQCLEQLKTIPHVEYLVVTGIFTGDIEAKIDLLIVGGVSKDKLAKIMAEFEDIFNKEVRYTCMSTKEFLYRRSVVDRFIYDIIDRKHIVLVDAIKEVAEKTK